MRSAPLLQRVEQGDVVVLADPALREEHGVVVAFSERSGGVSAPPFGSLNLAGHVGDEPGAVDENRLRLMRVLGMESERERLVTAEQVHGDTVELVDAADAGRGAHVFGGATPVAGTDGLVTIAQNVPLLMMYADCVPVVLVSTGTPRGIAVVHAGWKGALARIPANAVRALSASTGSQPESIVAYVGPHICSCCYEVDESRMSQFANAFDTIAAASGHLDLSRAVRESLTDCGVSPRNIVEAELCTHDHADRFYSFRAEPTTGRHGAIAAIIPR